MRILGLSAFYHDASASLAVNGQLIASAAEERFSGQKHDPNFPKFAVDFCLRKAGLRAEDLDAVVFYEEPHTKFTRVLSSALAGYPRSREGFVRSMRTWMASKLWIKNSISKRLRISPAKIHFSPHHLSHAAQAFLSSPFEEAAVLVIDSVGEWDCTSLYSASRIGGVTIRKMESFAYPNSLGLVYSAFTAFLGFRVNDEECSTMALAAFGRPRFADVVRKIVRGGADGGYDIDPTYFTFDEFREHPFTAKFIAAFGQPRASGSPLPFSSLNPASVTPEAQRFADVAASIQTVFEEVVLALCQRLKKITGLQNLCFAGGAALNCVANAKIERESGFADIFVPPDPGDGGASIGAALYGHVLLGGESKAGIIAGPYLGEEFDEAAELAMLGHVKPDRWIRHRQAGSLQQTGMRLKIERYSEIKDALPEIVTDLTAGKIVGWFQGRFENGPRALGNRSLLADPSRLDVARKISEQVKLRAKYRPYALSVTDEDAGAVLAAKSNRLSRWMQASSQVKAEAVSAVASTLHVDGSTRPQRVSKFENPAFHALLEAFGQSTGQAALLNTSLNARGAPLVSSPVEALMMFARTDMDTLVLNRSVIRKVV